MWEPIWGVAGMWKKWNFSHEAQITKKIDNVSVKWLLQINQSKHSVNLVSSGGFTNCCEPAFKLSPTTRVQGLSSRTLAKLSRQHGLQTLLLTGQAAWQPLTLAVFRVPF